VFLATAGNGNNEGGKHCKAGTIRKLQHFNLPDQTKQKPNRTRPSTDAPSPGE
jgi:hypothetical protein